jgi:signal transduction histidine kinase
LQITGMTTRLHRWSWLIAMVIAILITLGGVVVIETLHRQINRQYDRALLALQWGNRINELSAMLAVVSASQRGYLLTSRPLYLEPYQAAAARIQTLSGKLMEHYHQQGDREGLVRFTRLNQEFGRYLALNELSLRYSGRQHANELEALLRTDLAQESMNRWTVELAMLHDHEQLQASAAVADTQAQRERSQLIVALVASLNISLFIVLFFNLGRQIRHQQRQQQTMLAQHSVLDALVHERTAQLEQLAEHLQHVSEEEKSRLARELHDELGAILTASKMDVAWIQGKLKTHGDAALIAKINRVLGSLEQGIQIKSRLIEGLRPSILTNFGLVTALQQLAHDMAKQNAWILELDWPERELNLPETVSIALYRIAQESLNNASKYARASKVRMTLSLEPQRVCMAVEDNGVGMAEQDAEQPKRHGLLGMRQRVVAQGGRFEVLSTPGRGTRIAVDMPLATPASEHEGTPAATATPSTPSIGTTGMPVAAVS